MPTSVLPEVFASLLGFAQKEHALKNARVLLLHSGCKSSVQKKARFALKPLGELAGSELSN